MSNAVGIKVC